MTTIATPRAHVDATRFAAMALIVVVGVEAAWLALAVIGPDPVWSLGMDFRYYMSLGAQWLADGSFYLPHQLTGQPYQAQLLGIDPTTSTLYPPSALLLFVPFSLAPAVLWWTIPIAVATYAVWRLEPAPWALPVMLVMLAWPRAIGAYLFGNTDMWITAAVAAGLIWGWPALVVTLKPTLAPLAFIGVRRVSWWIGAAAGLAFVALTFPMWLDYLTAMSGIQGLDLGYSLGSLPLVCIPLVAWAARDRGTSTLSPRPGHNRRRQPRHRCSTPGPRTPRTSPP